MEKYLDVIRQVDYRDRSNRSVFDLYSGWGMERAVSSQDRMKFIACCLTGGLRINTTACLGQYIGRVGVHCTEEMFLRNGYHRTELYPDGPLSFAPLADIQFETLLAAQRSKVTATAPMLRPGNPMSFGKGSLGSRALRHGFYNPDLAGAWSATQQSEVSFTLDGRSWSGGGVLEMETCHALPPGHERATVEVTCNGVECGRLTIGRGLRRGRLEVPSAAVALAQSLDIRLVSPVAGQRDDGLAQTVFLSSLALHPR